MRPRQKIGLAKCGASYFAAYQSWPADKKFFTTRRFHLNISQDSPLNDCTLGQGGGCSVGFGRSRVVRPHKIWPRRSAQRATTKFEPQPASPPRGFFRFISAQSHSAEVPSSTSAAIRKVEAEPRGARFGLLEDFSMLTMESRDGEPSSKPP